MRIIHAAPAYVQMEGLVAGSIPCNTGERLHLEMMLDRGDAVLNVTPLPGWDSVVTTILGGSFFVRTEEGAKTEFPELSLPGQVEWMAGMVDSVREMVDRMRTLIAANRELEDRLAFALITIDDFKTNAIKARLAGIQEEPSSMKLWAGTVTIPGAQLPKTYEPL